MAFKSDRQRKAVMAKMKGGARSNVSPQIIVKRDRQGFITSVDNPRGKKAEVAIVQSGRASGFSVRLLLRMP